jgi:WD40-like Beta Propeller Repeat
VARRNVLLAAILVGTLVQLGACSDGYDGAESASPDAGGSGADASAADSMVSREAGSDAPAGTSCNPTAPFDSTVLVAELSDTAESTVGVRLSADGLTAFFARTVPGASWDVFSVTRFDAAAAFGAPSVVAPITTADGDSKPSVTSDRNRLYFSRDTGSTFRIWVAVRTGGGFYSAPTILDTNVNDPSGPSGDPFISPDGEELFFGSIRADAGPGGIYVASGPTSPTTFTTVAPTGLLGNNPVISADRLSLYFAKAVGLDTGVWVAQRPTLAAPFGTPTKLSGPDLDTVGQRDDPSWISPDQCTLYLFSNRAGVFATYRATRKP